MEGDNRIFGQSILICRLTLRTSVLISAVLFHQIHCLTCIPHPQIIPSYNPAPYQDYTERWCNVTLVHGLSNSARKWPGKNVNNSWTGRTGAGPFPDMVIRMRNYCWLAWRPPPMAEIEPPVYLPVINRPIFWSIASMQKTSRINLILTHLMMGSN